ncbi:tetratricopeptide repeat protein [Candidatus Micrarchaeota archaeon]|nr:tetratricopeptide repeat protein [Candidatus Micrarchaeota archaeon]
MGILFASTLIILIFVSVHMTDELEDGMISKAETLEEEQKGEEAVQTAAELVAIDPKDSIVWFVKGKAHYVAEQFEESLACLAKAAELGQENPQVWHMMAYALVSLRRYEEAVPCLEYVVSKEPQNVEAIGALAILHVISGDAKTARQFFDSAFGADKRVAVAMAEHFYDKFFSTSPNVPSSAKALAERVLETAKLVK